jgi:hypothetical protein
MKKWICALGLAGLVFAPAAMATPTVTESDVFAGTSGALGYHVLTFTVTNNDATTMRFSERSYSLDQQPVTPVDDPLGPGATYCFAHGVCRTTVYGCVAFGMHLRTGGTGYGGTQCGVWFVAPGETRVIVTDVPSWYAAPITYGTFWSLT